MTAILSRLMHRATVIRVKRGTASQYGLPRGQRLVVGTNIPCLIEPSSGARAIRYGKPTDTESGTALFEGDRDIQLGDTIEYQGRILRVDSVRPQYHPSIGDIIDHLHVGWTIDKPEATP